MTEAWAVDSGLLTELRWVHDMIRRDLATCRELAASADAGLPAPQIRSRVEALRTRGPLFQLRLNCLRHCQLVHAHHNGESAMLFPAIRSAAPELSAAVERLESDHRKVSVLLDEVQAAAVALADPPDPQSRRSLAAALRDLSDLLLEHLSFEEEALAPVLTRWASWPFFS